MTTVVPGLHPVVTAALEARQCGTLTSVQHQTLSRIAAVTVTTTTSSTNKAVAAASSESTTNNKSGVAAENSTGAATTKTSPNIPSDCIVETPRGSGHLLCMIAYTAHFVHTFHHAENCAAPFAIIVSRDVTTLVRTLNISSMIAIPNVKFIDASTLDNKAQLGGTSHPLSRSVVVGTANHLANLDWAGASTRGASCVTFVVEEACPVDPLALLSQATGGASAAAAASSSATNNSNTNNNSSSGGGTKKVVEEAVKKIVDLVGRVSSLWRNLNVCLMSIKPPSSVHPTLRYLLRRSNRVYLPARSAIPTFSSCLVHNANDRSALCYRLIASKQLRRILILTHNREVKELKTELHKNLGIRTFAIQRTTATVERERILGDFLNCDHSVLVAMDAFTGIDLMDVDGVIQYYPPQKSMSDDEWSEFVSFLKTTGQSDPERFRVTNTSSSVLAAAAATGSNKDKDSNIVVSCATSCIVSLAAIDDLNLVKHFQSKIGYTGPVINISPSHANFEDFVLQPNLAVLARLPGNEQESSWATSTPPPCGAPLTMAAFKELYELKKISPSQLQQQQNKNRISIPAPSSNNNNSSSGNKNNNNNQRRNNNNNNNNKNDKKNDDNKKENNNNNKNRRNNNNNNKNEGKDATSAAASDKKSPNKETTTSNNNKDTMSREESGADNSNKNEQGGNNSGNNKNRRRRR